MTWLSKQHCRHADRNAQDRLRHYLARKSSDSHGKFPQRSKYPQKEPQESSLQKVSYRYFGVQRTSHLCHNKKRSFHQTLFLSHYHQHCFHGSSDLWGHWKLWCKMTKQLQSPRYKNGRGLPFWYQLHSKSDILHPLWRGKKKTSLVLQASRRMHFIKELKHPKTYDVSNKIVREI